MCLLSSPPSPFPHPSFLASLLLFHHGPLSLSLYFSSSLCPPLFLPQDAFLYPFNISNVLTLFSGGWLHSHILSMCWQKWSLATLDMHHALFLELVTPEGKNTSIQFLRKFLLAMNFSPFSVQVRVNSNWTSLQLSNTRLNY